MRANERNRYESIPKRSFRSAVIRLLEEQYKIIGSHKVLQMIADDILSLHKEFYPETEKQPLGAIVWQSTAATCKKPSYGTKVEDYEVKTVVLPLITQKDVEVRINHFYGHPRRNENYQKMQERDIEVMARLVKSAYEQGGLLSGAELSVLLNRSLTTIGRYMRLYHESHQDILPTKGMILEQGSKPTHKAAIIDLYEQGYPEVDIARLSNHQLESTGRYIRNYKRVQLLLEKGFSLMEMVRLSGMGRSTIIEYRELVYRYHSQLRSKEVVSHSDDEAIDQSRSKPPSGLSEGRRKTKK